MEEQRHLKKQFFLHIIYNMIAFSLTFTVFGMFMAVMVKNITFSSVDQQLKEAKGQFSDQNEKIEILYRIFDLENLGIFQQEMKSFSNYNIGKRIENPQIIFILRDENGAILNENELGRIEDYEADIQFDEQNLDKIYQIKLGNKFNYRCLDFALEKVISEDSQKCYVQLMMNVDSEISLINNYLEIITYAVIVGILLSGIASLILSQKALKPVQEILNKQIEFVQNASHELRTPLTIIQAKQELLLQEPNAKIIDKSEDIMLTLNETKRLSKLIKDLMILARGSNVKLQKEEVNIDELICQIVLPYQDIALAQEKKISLDLKFGKEVSVDINKMHQLFVILLDNAMKYTEKGDTIQIRTALKDNKCIIEVADTGIGISEKGIKHVFDRFYREDRARNRETGGSGLGLSIATTIVKAHNGTIKALHNTPKGTIFMIRLNR